MTHRDSDSTADLLQELLWAYGPCGKEEAVRAVCARELRPVVDDMWTDDAGNLIGYISSAKNSDDDAAARRHHRWKPAAGPGAATRVMAHMDELSMLVKRIDPDGTLHLTQLGTMYPGNFGLGPVAVLGDHETFTAVLALGSEHTTKESPRIWETKPDGVIGRWIGSTSTSSPAAVLRSLPTRAFVPAPGSASSAARERWSTSATTWGPTSSMIAPR
jgi:M42 glutamyl aminopeptidase